MLFIWLVALLICLIGLILTGAEGKSGRFRPRLEQLEVRYAPAATFTWAYTGAGAGDFMTAANWSGGPVGQVPGQDDTIRFDATSVKDCTLNQSAQSKIVARIQMVNAYTGTFKLDAMLGVTSGGTLEGGTIIQSNGDASTLGFGGGTTTWKGTVLNGGQAVSSLIVGAGATFDVTSNAATIGDNLKNSGTVHFKADMASDVTFTNNAGITNNSGASIFLDSGKSLKNSGTGIILNSGLVEKTTTSTDPTLIELPLVNSADTASLKLYGDLVFSKAGQQSGVSVLQNNGSVYLYDAVTLELGYGYTQNGGYLQTSGYLPNNGSPFGIFGVAGGTTTVRIHGGTVLIGADGGYGWLRVNGSFIMDGGTWDCFVNGADLPQSTLIYASGGITLGGTSSLSVITNNVPAGGIPAGKTVTIMAADAGHAISGDFATKNLYPVGTWTAGIDAGNSNDYDLTS